MSWTAATLEVLAAATLGLVGALVLRAGGGFVSSSEVHASQRPLLAALLHPVSVATIVGNVVILGISFADLL
ncbi:MAG: hypothetical protein H0U29_04940 [Acidimicrobiia bacterium]|nr:hypothetical protein [Acidimicrobiia bacterium]